MQGTLGRSVDGTLQLAGDSAREGVPGGTMGTGAHPGGKLGGGAQGGAGDPAGEGRDTGDCDSVEKLMEPSPFAVDFEEADEKGAGGQVHNAATKGAHGGGRGGCCGCVVS